MAKSKKNSTPKTSALQSNDHANINQHEMNTNEIRDLIDFISQSGLNEVNIETKELKLHVKREPDQKVMKSSPAPIMTMQAAPVAAPIVAPSPPRQEKPTTVARKTIDIKSPMIGTFYRSANPDSPPFISVGDKVS